MNNPRPIVLGSYSPSQNGIIVSPHGIALWIGRQRAYDDLLKQFKDAVMVIGKQNAIIKAYKHKLEEMEKEVQQ